jgi:hypothetical protein
MIEAAVIAGEPAQGGEWYNGHVVYVTDEHGNEIGRVPVVTAIELRRAQKTLHYSVPDRPASRCVRSQD